MPSRYPYRSHPWTRRQGCQSYAGEVEQELLIVDGLTLGRLLEADLEQLGVGVGDTEVILGQLTLADETSVLDIIEERGCLVGSVGLNDAFPSKYDIAGGDGRTVGPAGIILDAKLQLTLARGLVLLEFIALDQVLLNLAIRVQGEQGIKHQSDNLGESLVVIRLGRVEVIHIVGQIHGDGLSLVGVA